MALDASKRLDNLAKASLLNAACRYDAADALMLREIAQVACPAAVFAHFIKLAKERGDWFGVVERAARMRERFPDDPQGFLSPVEAFRQLGNLGQADAFAAEGRERFPRNPWFLVEWALLAEIRGDWARAAAIMAELRALLPGRPMPWIQSAKHFARGGRMAEAEALLREALPHFPGNADLHLLHANALEGQARWQDADVCWQTYRARFPADTEIALRRALIWSKPPGAMRDMRDFPEVFRRLETLHEDMPDFAGGYGAHLRVLREQDRLDDAVRLGARARALFPADAGVAIEYARAVRAADGALAACDILAAAVAGSPDDPHAAAEHVAMLAEAGLLDAAEAACLAATARFRFHPRPLIELADVAMRRGDMPAALARWIDGATRFPQHPVFQRGIARARLAMIGRSAAGEVLADESGGGDSIRHLLMRFESLGGPGMGCEFGLVQRQAGAEPLGLLRWTGITAGKLREALAARFDGVGSPAQTELSLNEASREYDVFDRRFAMRTHSFVRETAMPRDKLFEDVCAQAGYLRRKLLRELEAARKVFVFRFGAVAPAAGEIEGLFEALQDFGELTLLCVVNADERHRAGSVEMLRPRLLVGYAPELLAWGLTETASWHEICRVAVGFRE